jgi:hypothetical protein
LQILREPYRIIKKDAEARSVWQFYDSDCAPSLLFHLKGETIIELFRE